MNVPLPPTDTLIMLGRIEGKLDLMIGTVSDHSTRIAALEKSRDERTPLVPVVHDLEARVDDLEKSRDQVSGGWSFAQMIWPVLTLSGIAGVVGHFLPV